MIQRNNYILQNAVDSRWFLDLKAIRRPLLLKSLEITKDSYLEEKKKFSLNNQYNPDFKYSNLDVQAILEGREKLLKLRDQVWQNEEDSSIRLAYVEKITELIDEQGILLSTAKGDYQSFDTYNHCRFGELNQELVAALVANLNSRYGYELPVLGEIELLSFDNEVIKSQIQKCFATWPSIEVSKEHFTAAEVCALWQSELDKFAKGWQVVSSGVHFNLKVDSKRRKVFVPENIKLKGASVTGLFAHEIGTHVYRREQGKKFPVQLLSIGLAGNDIVEEGIALVREYSKKRNVTNLKGGDKYLALAYALGLVDGVKKDFKDTYAFLRDYYHKRHQRLVGDDIKAKELAAERAWNSTVRVFRGGNTSRPGSCFYRDKVYREGYYKILEIIQMNPEYMDYAHFGKLDIANQKQRDLVDKFK